MRQLFSLVVVFLISMTSFAAVTYELNGGVTNNDNWLSKGDMFTAFMTDAGATEFETWEYYMAQANPLGSPNICAKLTDASPALAMEKWAWLKAYIEKAHTDQAAEGASVLPADGTGVAWRYAVGAFFISGKNGGWPVSADFSKLGLDEAYIPVWKHAYANPTEPTTEWVLNAPYKEGFTFAGWYATADFSGEKVTTINAETVGTLYAKWVDYIPTIAEVSALADDTETKCSGVVNHIDGRNIYIQDATGGILVYTLEVSNCQVGDKIIVKGVKDMYGGAPEVKSAVIESAEAASVDAPTVFETLEALVADSIEHKYFASNVQIVGVTIVEYDGYNNPTVQDATGEKALCYKMVLNPTVFPIGTKVNVTAVAGWYHGFRFVGDATGIEKLIAGTKDAYAYPARYDGRYQLTNTWVISNNEDNFAANKPGYTDYVRGMAVKDGKMYFINRNTRSITVVDGATGNMLDPIFITGNHLFEVQDENGEWKSACTLPYNDIKFDDAGNCLIGSCTTTGAAKCQTFFIYVVDLETGVCTKLIEDVLWENPGLDQVQFRFDAFGVAGNVKENGVIMAAEDQGSWDVYRWKITNGVAAPAERIVCNATGSLYQEGAGFGTAAQIFPQDETGSVFYVDGYNTLPMLFDENGMLLDDFINCPYGTQIVNVEGDICKMNTGHNGLCEFQVGDEYFLVMAATNTVGSPSSSFALYKFADESRMFAGLEPLWYFPANGMGSVTNGCRVAMPCVEVEGDKAYIYLYVNNNGYARYELNVDASIALPEPVVNEYTIRIKKDEISDMDLSNGLYLYRRQTIQNGQLASMTLNSDGWYTTTIATTATFINCLAVNVDVNTEGWIGQQTIDYTHIKGDVCLMIGAQDDYYNGHYNLYAVPCEDMEYAREHNFEDTEKNVQWCFAQSKQTNYWTIGSAAGSANEGSNALYITNNGSNYGYSNARSDSWAYLPVTLSALDSITFDWKGITDGYHDNLQVYLFPKGYTPVAGRYDMLDQAILLGDYICGQEEWQRIGFFPAVEGEYNLCLRWRNDGSVGEMPIAVDNLSIFTAAGTIDYPLVYVLNADGTAIVAKCDAAYAGELTIPAYVYSEGRAYSVVAIEEKAFNQCYNITSVTIPNSVTSIRESAFMYCSSLTSVTLSENLAAIDNYTFYGCESLAAINVPNSVQSIGEEAFAYCYDLASMTIGSGVTSIADEAFGSCQNLTSLTIPSSVTYIASYAFWGTHALTSIVVKSGNTVYDSRNNCNAIVETATNTLITGCQSTIIPESITSLGAGAFNQCDNLTSITIPNSVTTIGTDAFYHCDNLSSVDLGEGVQTIGNYAFEYCDALASITIPASVTSIDNYAFYNCPTIVMEGATPPQIDVFTFNLDATILVPCTAVETYQAAEYWQNLNIQDNSYTIALSSSEGGSALVTSSDCATNVATIEAYAEEGYVFTQWSDGNTDNPRTLTLTQDTVLMAEFARIVSGQCGDNLYWSYNETAKTVSITGSGKMYDYTADTQPWLLFKEEIKEVIISNTAISIGISAFEGCIRLGKLSIGTGIENIKTNAFAECNRLYHIYCYPTYPPFADQSSFANYNVYLHVPCSEKEGYDLDIVWGNFKYIECLGAESEPVAPDTIIVTPGTTDVTITWPTEDNAYQYVIEIKKDGEVFCTLTFNADGQLLNIAFVPGRKGTHSAQYAAETANGLRFTVTGLEEGTNYTYDVITKDKENNQLSAYSGEFTTYSNTPSDLENLDTQSPKTDCQKLLRDGQLLILKDDNVYTIMGQEIQ